MRLASEIIDLTKKYEGVISQPPSDHRTLTLADATRLSINLFDHDIPGPNEPLPNAEGWDVSSRSGSSGASGSGGEDSSEAEQEDKGES